MADILIGSSQTNENGLAAFTGLPPGTYKYKQTSATTGYTSDTTEYTITISNAIPVEADRTNSPAATGTITITKSVAGFPAYVLPGATFKLADSNGKALVSVSTPTSADGTLTFQNVMSIDGTPQTYEITEVSAPSGYEQNTTKYDVPVSVGQVATQAVPNTPSVQGALDITLTDTNYTNYGLQGSGYDLYLVTD
ncbi:MAG: SpaA isopeptide-forming pilin-related protein [Clostridium sp.]|uniref:MSCRAMM family protein n=1 Tax=Clostridium sp. TaxID=1506 RepID=UPI002906F2CF|nr:SpaA isopeptide-forming pilin-related protein [Clostridium sp.]MDU7338802.1 SpaA isopeptide-forming pilin-related protein [Clostridium sp.]